MRSRWACPSVHIIVIVGLVALCAHPAASQDTETGLRDQLAHDLFTFGACGEPLCLDLPVGNVHGSHFIPALAEGNDAVIAFLTDAIGDATASVPLSATSSGATFSVVGGVPVRTSISAGPIFGERTQTLGRGRYFIGASVTGMEFTSLNGVPLRDLALNFKHEDTLSPDTLGTPEFENDYMALDLAVSLNILVGTIAVTAGLTDAIDVGVAVPLVRTQVSGRSEAQILPFGSTAIHRFGGDATDPVLRATASTEGSATGIGDIAGRVKINLGQGPSMGAALLAEIRLPTGDEEDLLGSGSTQFRALGLYSAQFGTFSPHVNLGYVARGDSKTQNDAVLLGITADNLLSEWATLAVGFESELQVGDNKFDLPPDIEFSAPFGRTIHATNVPNKSGNLLRASLGAKFTVRGGTVLVVNALLPLRSVGLQPDFIWTVGLDFPF
jgi:hypothetical protein